MSIKISGRFSAFLFLSLAVHITATVLFIYNTQTHKTATIVPDERKTPIFVDVVDLPPWLKGVKETPEKPSRMSDRNMVVKKETVPEGAPKGYREKEQSKGKPALSKVEGKEKGEKNGKEKVLAAKDVLEKEKEKTVSETVDKAIGKATELEPIKKPEEKRKGDSTEESTQAKTPVLFPSDERLRELSKVYEAESPKGEKGKTLSINTSESKYRKYLLNMKRRIELFWSYPESSIRSGEQGKMRIDFTIAKDGSVKDVRVVKSSNYPALDDAAVTAVKLASPFNPFPNDFDIETVEIHASFEYSLIF
ncbi:MAG: energy transducer TonB [Thermodesulfobacteriota bacterium]